MFTNYSLSDILNIPPYSLGRDEKHSILTSILSELTCHHYERCVPYRRILKTLSVDIKDFSNISDIPFLPVRLFKNNDLLSINKSEVVKTMTSSGTTGQEVSKIYLDKETAINQQKALVKIVSSFVGPKRFPMVILDSSAVIKDRNMFSARGAGILGFSILGSEKVYALNENMQLDVQAIAEFLEKHKDKRILLFGFTYMIWQHFYLELVKTGYKPDFSKGILFHGGGWKKLLNEAVSPKIFRQKLYEACGLTEIHDYYGMVEQTGSIYVECEQGFLHAPVFSDILTRRPMDFTPAEYGEKGIVEVLSILPGSYPGHALLTEDEGVIFGEDDCPCRRLGKYFKITGRLKNAEIRGCSDTYGTKLT